MSTEGFIFHCDCCLVPKLRNWGGWKELGGLLAQGIPSDFKGAAFFSLHSGE
jgi:hypothetical protein